MIPNCCFDPSIYFAIMMTIKMVTMIVMTMMIMIVISTMMMATVWPSVTVVWPPLL